MASQRTTPATDPAPHLTLHQCLPATSLGLPTGPYPPCLPAWPACPQVPLDGEVVHGRAMVSSEHITGESLPVLRRVGDEVSAEWARGQHRELLD